MVASVRWVLCLYFCILRLGGGFLSWVIRPNGRNERTATCWVHDLDLWPLDYILLSLWHLVEFSRSLKVTCRPSIYQLWAEWGELTLTFAYSWLELLSGKTVGTFWDFLFLIQSQIILEQEWCMIIGAAVPWVDRLHGQKIRGDAPSRPPPTAPLEFCCQFFKQQNESMGAYIALQAP